LGVDAKDAGIVAMWENRVMLDGLQAVAEGFRNFVKGFKGHALPGPDGYEQIPELVERGRLRTENFFKMLDRRLGESEYIAGDSYTAADITAQVTVDFAGWIKMELPDELANAKRWHDTVNSRPSAKA
jgi:glutathione S-transferase